jgi:hypothetical protein
MPLETGIWTINANGRVGQLNINRVDPSGNLGGSLAIYEREMNTIIIQGYWDETSQKIRFDLTFSGVPEVYSGFMFQDQFRITVVIASVVFTLARFFEMFQGSPGSTAVSARRDTFG